MSLSRVCLLVVMLLASGSVLATDADYIEEIGQLFAQGSNDQARIRTLLERIENHTASSAATLALYHQKSFGGAGDMSQVIPLYAQSVALGSRTTAALELAFLHREGELQGSDPSQFANYLFLSAQLGHTSAQRLAAYALAKTDFVAHDDEPSIEQLATPRKMPSTAVSAYGLSDFPYSPRMAVYLLSTQGDHQKDYLALCEQAYFPHLPDQCERGLRTSLVRVKDGEVYNRLGEYYASVARQATSVSPDMRQAEQFYQQAVRRSNPVAVVNLALVAADAGKPPEEWVPTLQKVIDEGVAGSDEQPLVTARQRAIEALIRFYRQHDNNSIAHYYAGLDPTLPESLYQLYLVADEEWRTYEMNQYLAQSAAAGHEEAIYRDAENRRDDKLIATLAVNGYAPAIKSRLESAKWQSNSASVEVWQTDLSCVEDKLRCMTNASEADTVNTMASNVAYLANAGLRFSDRRWVLQGIQHWQTLVNVEGVIATHCGYLGLRATGQGFALSESDKACLLDKEQVKRLSQHGFNQVAAIDDATIALLNNGQVIAWGDPFRGGSLLESLIGYPSYASLSEYRRKHDELQQDVIEIANTHDHFVALKDDGTLWQWGLMQFGISQRWVSSYRNVVGTPFWFCGEGDGITCWQPRHRDNTITLSTDPNARLVPVLGAPGVLLLSNGELVAWIEARGQRSIQHPFERQDTVYNQRQVTDFETIWHKGMKKTVLVVNNGARVWVWFDEETRQFRFSALDDA
ncbi:hypothetical protein [Thaumasiovibrio subtropicus]|uniref:hypothetical protein n=1 Tax=Thaumasiovibrio subtropicus TaxID=1891207 RepID=UPI00131C3E4C|nr:hypothetical protein [Thaumasiovibrio subtropicus]